MIKTAERLQKLPPHVPTEFARKIAAEHAQGIDVISLDMGDLDTPTPTPEIIIHEIASWYRDRFGIELNPQDEVLLLSGITEGITQISLCYVDPGDINLVPDPGFPVYAIGTEFAGGGTYKMPLFKENDFLPDLTAVPTDVARKAKLLFINYPNNPTGAVATSEFFAELVRFAKEFDILVCHDATYSETGFNEYKAPSFLQTPGAKEIGIEFHSLSATYNTKEWGGGWAVGNSEAIEALKRIRTTLGAGIFESVQKSNITALETSNDQVDKIRCLYAHRRDLAVGALNALGWKLCPPKAGISLWVPVPPGYQSTEFAAMVLDTIGVAITPGVSFGEYGEGYFQISLTTPTERLREAFARWQKARIVYA